MGLPIWQCGRGTCLRRSSELPRKSAFGVCPRRAFCLVLAELGIARSLIDSADIVISAFLFFCGSACALTQLTHRERVILASRTLLLINTHLLFILPSVYTFLPSYSDQHQSLHILRTQPNLVSSHRIRTPYQAPSLLLSA